MQSYQLLQDAIRDMSKKDALDHLTYLFPHKARKWFERNLRYLMALTPDLFYEAITYNDPTATKAIRNLEGVPA